MRRAAWRHKASSGAAENHWSHDVSACNRLVGPRAGKNPRWRAASVTLLGALLVLAATPRTRALVGGAPLAEARIARHVVLIVGSAGSTSTFCTGVAVSRTLLLTAAHCTLPGADYKWVEFAADGAPTLNDVAAIVRHPQFDLKALFAHRATADVALLKSAQPLPARFAPAPLAAPAPHVAVGDQFAVAGYGVTVRGDGRSGGKIRAAILVATGNPGALQVRLVDPATRNQQPGLGACTGDSGAPVFDLRGDALAVMGVVSWSTAARNEAGCGGLTGVTPLERYRPWIVDMAARMGSPL